MSSYSSLNLKKNNFVKGLTNDKPSNTSSSTNKLLQKNQPNKKQNLTDREPLTNSKKTEYKNNQTNPDASKPYAINTEINSTPQPKKIMTPNSSDTKNPKYYSNHSLGEGGSAQRNKYNQAYGTSTGNGDNSLSPFDYKPSNGLEIQDLNTNTSHFGDVNQRKELLIMTIDIGNGYQDNLYVYEDDDPYIVAKDFCSKHQLDENVIYPLSQNIYSNMEEVLKERMEMLDKQSSEKSNSPKKQNQSNEIKEKIMKEGNNGDSKKVSMTNGNDSKERISRDEDEKNKPQIVNFFKQTNLNENKNSTNLATSIPNNPNKSVDNKPATYQTRIPEYHSNFSSRQSHIKKSSSEDNQRIYTGPPVAIMPSSPKVNQNGMQSGKSSASKVKTSGLTSKDKENDLVDNLISNSMAIMKDKSNHSNNELRFAPVINPISQIIIDAKKNNIKQPAYERLHSQAKSKNKKSDMSKNQETSPKHQQVVYVSSTKNTENSETNYGSLLYQKGIKRREEKNKLITQIKNQELELEKRQCTFQPALNPISTEIINSKSRNEPLEELLIRYGKAAKEKAERARNLKQREEIDNCSFKPTINIISDKIAERMQIKGKNHFEKLHEDYKIRNDHQKELARLLHTSECTFTPAINNFQGSSIDIMTFEDRNLKFMDRLEKIERIRKAKEEDELIDNNTGKPLFRPSICRSPKAQNRNQNGLPVGEYLYNIRNDMENRKRELYEREQKSQEAMMVRSNQKSNVMIEEIKRKKLIDIFNAFDSDGDGLISSTRIDVSKVDINILELFTPLLYEMEELNHALTLDEFIEGSEKLLKSLSVDERNRFLLNKRSNTEDFEKDMKFKPEINKRSARIASNLRPYGDPALFDVYIKERKEFLDKLNLIKEKKNQDELKECSFKPKILSSPAPAIIINQPKNL